MLIERLRRALEPDYEVLREIAGGGMGVVYAARQRRLDRPVAVKILRPELATAIGAERFQSEGRLLARLNHPNIVPVYDAGEADGILYLVMEYIEGETLAERLSRGPLGEVELAILAKDLLAALAEAHAHGIIHRDVKPGNIFLRSGRALLADFGIARGRMAPHTGLTLPGQVVGTPVYMAPEQHGGEVTPATDLYAAGLVLYESGTGIRWPVGRPPREGDWRRLPAGLAPAIRQALAVTPQDRWPSATAMREALDHPARWGRRVGFAGAGLLVAAAGWWALRPPPLTPAGLRLVVEPFRVEGSPAFPSLGDSIAATLADALSGNPDFQVVRGGAGRGDASTYVLEGTARLPGDRLELSVRGATRGGSRREVDVRVSGSPSGWRILADSLAFRLLQELWALQDSTLPMRALPASPGGQGFWWEAERLLAAARWEEAAQTFVRAERYDSTCYLCSYRLLDIDRWLGRPHDPLRLARVIAARGLFPLRYQILIDAARAALPGRLELLRQATAVAPGFHLAWFELGDELFHRGPLWGHLRWEALAPLELTVRLRPEFGPGWEHLLWLRLSEGDSLTAAAALEALQRVPHAGSGFSAALRMTLLLGYHWRFLPADSARRFTRSVLTNPAIAADPDAAAGGRLMMTADAPRGAVEVGGMLATAWPDRSDAVAGGFLGQMMGYAALGQLDSLRATSASLARASPDPNLSLVALELETALRVFDPNPAVRRSPSLATVLAGYARGGGVTAERARWAVGLLEVLAWDRDVGEAALRALPTSEASASYLASLRAARLLRQGDAGAALRALPPLPPLDSAIAGISPVLDPVVRLLRAEAQVATGDSVSARATLRWHEHLQTIGHLTGPPQAGELGWAMGTLARWRRASLLAPEREAAERCRVLEAVTRLWQHAPAPFGDRADSASAQRTHQCPAAR